MKKVKTLVGALALSCILSISVALAQQSYVAVDETASSSVATTTVTSVTSAPRSTTLTVQKVAQVKPLSASQKFAVEAYLKKHNDKNSLANREALRAALGFLLGINQSHLPLSRTPNEYLSDYQSYTQTMERTDFYVRVPIQRLELPSFTAGASQGPLILDDVPSVSAVAAPCSGPGSGATSLSHPGDRQESPIASGWKSWTKVPTIPIQKVVPPSPYCPPGLPPAKPPTTAPIGDPSGLNPNGPPAPNGPPSPSGDQRPVIIGDNSTVIRNPTPTNPHVADPVR